MLKMKPIKIQIDSDQEDDGLYGITFWFFDDEIGYISFSRDDFEDPNRIYVEYTDQKNGFFIEKIEYSIKNKILELNLVGGAEFYFNKSPLVKIELNEGDWIDVDRVLNRIIETHK